MFSRGSYRAVSTQSSLSAANARAFRHLLKTSYVVAHRCELSNPQDFVKYTASRFRTVAEANKKAQIRKADIRKHHQMVIHYAKTLQEAYDDLELISILNALAAGVGSSVYKRTLEKGFFDLVLFRKRSVERGEADEEETAERQNRIMQAAIAPIAEKLTHMHKGYSIPELRNAMSTSKVGTSVVAASHGSSEVCVEIDDELNKQTIYIRVEEDEYMNAMLRYGEQQQKKAKAMMEKQSSSSSKGDGYVDRFGDGAASTPPSTSNSYSTQSPPFSAPSTSNLKGGSPSSSSSSSSSDDGEYVMADDELHNLLKQLNERVEVSESDLIRSTTLHSYWASVASRLLDSIVEEMPLHRSRTTVVAGHGVGGAVALVIALQLHTMGYEVKNAISFGSPRIIQDTLNRYVAATSPIRVVINGDPCVQGPLTTSEGESFVHIGEVLTLDPTAPRDDDEEGDDEAEHESEENNNNNKEEEDGDEYEGGKTEAFAGQESSKASGVSSAYARRFSIHTYARHLANLNIALEYSEVDDTTVTPEWREALRRHTEGLGGSEPLMHGQSESVFDR